MDKVAQFNFVWLFAILAGGAILFLAIFGAVKTGDTQSVVSDTVTAKSLAILTDPLQSGFASASFGTILFREETRINVACDADGLGSMRVSVDTRSKPNDQWSRGGVDVRVPSKYIFAHDGTAAETFVVFSKPFFFPYKVADLTFLITDEYCFVDAPKAIADDLTRLNPPNIEVGVCNASDSLRVCFRGGSECDMVVSCQDTTCTRGSVAKRGETFSFAGNLLYGAIFSSNEIYECNAKRLAYRAEELAQVLMEKTDVMAARDCGSNLKADLFLWANRLSNASARTFAGLQQLSVDLDRKNKLTRCKAWQ